MHVGFSAENGSVLPESLDKKALFSYSISLEALGRACCFETYDIYVVLHRNHESLQFPPFLLYASF